MSTYTINIEFVGLCFFATQADRVGVLFPSTRMPCCHCDMEEHKALLHYATTEVPKRGDWKEIPLEKQSLDLTHVVGTSQFDPHVPESVVDLYPYADKMVDATLLTSLAPSCVDARILLDSGTAMAVPAEAEWEFHDRPNCGSGSRRLMSHRLTWQISGVTMNPLVLEFKGLHGAANGKSETIVPTSQFVHFVVRHIPSSGMPLPGFCVRAEHFECYYGMLPGAGKKVVPRFRQKTGIELPDPFGIEKEFGLSDNYTCMLAQAPVGP